MIGLSVSVTLPGASPTTYLFDEFPVYVGRDDACHLSIPHQAVPRRLCSAWIEADGENVRIEERPGLTNPLLNGTTRVSGGITGKDLRLSVGPVVLRFCPENRVDDRPKKKRTVFIGGTAALMLVLAVLVAPRTGRRGDGVDALLASLPKTPLCDVGPAACDNRSVCAERARLLHSRGEEILSHPNSTDIDRIQGVSMLREASSLLSALGDDTSRVDRAAGRAGLAVTKTYQQEIMRLKTALGARRNRDVVDIATTVSATLSACHTEAKQRLDRLIAVHRRALEASL